MNWSMAQLGGNRFANFTKVFQLCNAVRYECTEALRYTCGGTFNEIDEIV